MPIGKNALKRVTNNGYSNVTTSAPDMENSELLEAAATVSEKKTAAKKKAEKPAAKKTEPKAAPKKSAAKKVEKVEKAEPEVKAETTLEVVETSHPDGFIKISCGMDMPVYLL